jgi:hypothetical protein
MNALRLGVVLSQGKPYRRVNPSDGQINMIFIFGISIIGGFDCSSHKRVESKEIENEMPS